MSRSPATDSLTEKNISEFLSEGQIADLRTTMSDDEIRRLFRVLSPSHIQALKNELWWEVGTLPPAILLNNFHTRIRGHFLRESSAPRHNLDALNKDRIGKDSTYLHLHSEKWLNQSLREFYAAVDQACSAANFDWKKWDDINRKKRELASQIELIRSSDSSAAQVIDFQYLREQEKMLALQSNLMLLPVFLILRELGYSNIDLS